MNAYKSVSSKLDNDIKAISESTLCKECAKGSETDDDYSHQIIHLVQMNRPKIIAVDFADANNEIPFKLEVTITVDGQKYAMISICYFNGNHYIGDAMRDSEDGKIRWTYFNDLDSKYTRGEEKYPIGNIVGEMSQTVTFYLLYYSFIFIFILFFIPIDYCINISFI